MRVLEQGDFCKLAGLSVGPLQQNGHLPVASALQSYCERLAAVLLLGHVAQIKANTQWFPLCATIAVDHVCRAVEEPGSSSGRLISHPAVHPHPVSHRSSFDPAGCHGASLLPNSRVAACKGLCCSNCCCCLRPSTAGPAQDRRYSGATSVIPTSSQLLASASMIKHCTG